MKKTSTILTALMLTLGTASSLHATARPDAAQAWSNAADAIANVRTQIAAQRQESLVRAAAEKTAEVAQAPITDGSGQPPLTTVGYHWLGHADSAYVCAQMAAGQRYPYYLLSGGNCYGVN